jgi:hypothetical protein
VEVTDNYFSGNFSSLEGKSTSFKITAELSFHDREFGFHELMSGINRMVEELSHFLTIGAPSSSFQDRTGITESA